MRHGDRSVTRSTAGALLGQPLNVSGILATTDAVICSISGGLDSFRAAMAARARWPATPLILHHQFLSEDWPQTDAVLVRQAAALAPARLVISQPVYELNGKVTSAGRLGTHLKDLHLVRDGATYHGPLVDSDDYLDRDPEDWGPADKGEPIVSLMKLSYIARRGPPTKKIRFCTDYMKIRTLDRWMRAHALQLGATTMITGERWAESDTRINLPPHQWRFDTAANDVYWWRPILDLPFWQVAQDVFAFGGPDLFHPCYSMQGTSIEEMLDPEHDERGRSRCSCVYCIFSNPNHLVYAYRNHYDLVGEHINRVQRIERTTGLSWKQSGTVAMNAQEP